MEAQLIETWLIETRLIATQLKVRYKLYVISVLQLQNLTKKNPNELFKIFSVYCVYNNKKKVITVVKMSSLGFLTFVYKVQENVH